MAFCANCGAQLPANSTTCPACQKVAPQPGGAAAAPATAPVSGQLADNVAGMLAYITFIPAIIFLVMEPYNRSKFIRFHAFQCIFLTVALFAIHIALMFIPLIGWIISMFVSLASLALWVICLIKAYNHEMWKIPVIGDIAEKQANA